MRGCGGSGRGGCSGLGTYGVLGSPAAASDFFYKNVCIVRYALNTHGGMNWLPDAALRAALA